MERRDSPPKEESYLSGYEESFPGLNKAHGFFSLIQRNQRDRDAYHQQREELKQTKKLELQKERRSDRESRIRPSLQLYSPPRRYQTAMSREAVTSPPTEVHGGSNPCTRSSRYRVEVELQPQHWVTIVLEEQSLEQMYSSRSTLLSDLEDEMVIKCFVYNPA